MTARRSSPTLPLAIVDSREQQPLAPAVLLGGAPAPLPSRVVTLQSGDYSVEGFAPAHAVGDDGAAFSGAEHVVFERKSIADLWGTCFGRRNDALGEARNAVDRFRDECARLSRFARARIVIHGGWCPDIDGTPVHVDGTPAGLLVYARIRAARGGQRLAEENAASVMAILGAIDIDYGVPAQWCGSRGRAALYVGRALARVWWQAIGASQAREAEVRGVRVPWLRILEKEARDAA